MQTAHIDNAEAGFASPVNTRATDLTNIIKCVAYKDVKHLL